MLGDHPHDFQSQEHLNRRYWLYCPPQRCPSINLGPLTSQLSSIYKDIDITTNNALLINRLIQHSNLGCRTEMVWNDHTKRFQPDRFPKTHDSNSTTVGERMEGNKGTGTGTFGGSIEGSSNILLQTLTFLSNSFLPSGDLTSDYYRYTIWRAMQRLVGATLSVFGTQALLLALGFKKSSIG